MISLGSMFSREPAPLLGIDVSSTTVKLVELGRGRDGGLVLQHCAIEPLERGWINEGNVEKFDEVAEALRRLVRKAGTKTKNVAMALPGSAVITKKINLPAGLTDAELEVQVESEATQYIPFPLSEVSLDFCVVGPAANLPDYVEVLLAASRKEKVSDRQGLAEAAGLNPVVLDVESYASRLAASRLIETLPNKGRNMLIALFEVGSQTTSLQVIRNDEMIYERDQVFGGVQLSNQIARQYGIPFDEAEAKKRSGAGLPADYRDTVLTPFMEGVGQELGRALQFFFTSTPHNKVDHILLSGGSAALPGLAEAVMAQTSFPCKVINPFDGMAVAPSIPASRLSMEATSYLVATGLALRRFSQ
ncbi:pilus assembly protein PilM [Aquabacterium sp. A08]|uniref:pilus assembly protein PilM n=1 Tax=Aquabacterium sp. A08 TaxID=2718532 RepID=UPI001420B27F|nr:pilus assembly protein PilM [Aquabacterium sp. A08]NIC42460.1 pilus assembly protein PilM [Aquabacterium sp. A08]NIC42499.1 pilus assembly protein PilM [Aquabacterium sp. A08]